MGELAIEEEKQTCLLLNKYGTGKREDAREDDGNETDHTVTKTKGAGWREAECIYVCMVKWKKKEGKRTRGTR